MANEERDEFSINLNLNFDEDNVKSTAEEVTKLLSEGVESGPGFERLSADSGGPTGEAFVDEINQIREMLRTRGTMDIGAAPKASGEQIESELDSMSAQRGYDKSRGAAAEGQAQGVGRTGMPVVDAALAAYEQWAGQIVDISKTITSLVKTEADPFLTDFQKEREKRVTFGEFVSEKLGPADILLGAGRRTAEYEQQTKPEFMAQGMTVDYIGNLGQHLAMVGVRPSEVDPKLLENVTQAQLQRSRASVEWKEWAARKVTEQAGAQPSLLTDGMGWVGTVYDMIF